MKKTKSLISLIFLALLFVFGISKAHASGVNFSVKPELPSEQVKSNIGYFDLQMKPDEERTLSFILTNSSDKEIQIETTFGTAYTTNMGNVGYTPNGAKPDASLNINLKDHIKLPSITQIPAHSQVKISAQVTMPKENFAGVIAGGFNFHEKSDASSNSKSKKSGVSIVNTYTYVIGLVLQQSLDSVAPDLQLGTVAPTQVNGRNVIGAALTNPEKAYLMQMNTQAKIQSLNDSSLSYDYNNAQMEMAPNSNFNLAVPVSLQGALNGQSSEPLKPGKYRLTMTVYGNQNENGKYETTVNNKPTKYDYKWDFTKDFTISAQTANSLNAKDVSVPKSSPDWVMIIGFSLIVFLLLLIIFFLLFKRRKKDEEEEEK